MARQTIVWTALPHGRISEGPFAGRWRVSLVASPRLTPDKPTEQQLGAFKALLNWPETVRAFIPEGRKYITLGTDGFGRSDTRAALREFFGVDAAHITRVARAGLR